MRGVYYSACSLCYKTIGVTKNIRLLLRDGLLFRRLLLPESTVSNISVLALQRSLIILVGLTMTWYSGKMLISDKCICGRFDAQLDLKILDGI